MSRIGDLGAKLYSGEVSIDFVGRRRLWYTISGFLLALSVLALIFFPLKRGLEFVGGTELRVPNAQCSVEQARDAATGAGTEGVPTVQSIGTDTIRVATGEMPEAQTRKVRAALASACGVDEAAIGTTTIGPSWGNTVTGKATNALVVFLGLVMLFIWAYFREWRMAVAAIVALFHDLLITIAIYALARFEVTPATVIGLLTILGYSLYDTVVVFDKVRENTAGLQGGSRMTYSEAANLAVNQTLVRSINTSIVALLPVGAILFIGALLLGAGTLKDLALALFVGIAAGTYSSIFIATPLLAQLKEREKSMQALTKRVATRRAGGTAGP
ncbi:MAG: protein translocase subunit SecF, partial [Actinomycetota bacterium]|nr:protein translocase subunit SecF [Actinomycetota bacterium]